jgi:hypothetical protein
MAVDWKYYNKKVFKEIMGKYLPDRGEGETMATQAVTAVNKLVYKWYNDGDVFDNTGAMDGWLNDLSSYANWLHENIQRSAGILDRIGDCYNDDDYEDLLKDLADTILHKAFLAKLDEREREGSIYNCEGPFRFEEDREDMWW